MKNVAAIGIPCYARDEKLKYPRNNLQEDSQQQEQEAADEEPAHPRSAFAGFRHERKKKRDKPQ
jgi:hypothetical protein